MRTAALEGSVDGARWEGLVKRSPNGNVFQTPGMMAAFAADRRYSPGAIGCFEGDSLVGLLCWVRRSECRGLPGILTSRSTVIGGPVLLNDDSEVVRLLLEGYLQALGRRAVYTEFRNLFDLRWARPEFDRLGFSVQPHMNYLVDISGDDDGILAGMSQSRRKMLRRIEREGLLRVERVFSSEDMEQFYRLLRMTYSRVGKPYPGLEHFTASLGLLDDAGACFLCTFEGRPVASRFVLRYKGCVYDWYAGSDPGFGHLNPNEYLVWEIMRWGRDSGCRVFDFGGGGDPGRPYGPREFKRRFGGGEVHHDRFMKVHRPVLMAAGRLGFGLMQRVRPGRG